MARIFQRQEKRTMVTQALEQIREAIRNGKLKPGDRLVETELAEEMQISRFPIREALRYLEKEGLVVTVPYKGTSVAQFDHRDVEEIYTLRCALEELAVRRLLARLDQDKIRQLQRHIEAMEAAVARGDKELLRTHDMKFHETICTLADHGRLLAVWRTLQEQVRTFIGYEAFVHRRPEVMLQEHYPVMEAIKSGDPERAAASIRAHISLGLEVVARKGSGKFGRQPGSGEE